MIIESIGDSLEALAEAINEFGAEGSLGFEGTPSATHARHAEQAYPFRRPSTKALTRSERAELAARATELEPWLQGPFLLAEELVVGDTAPDALRWQALGQHVDTKLTGQRVLVIACGAGYDAFAFADRGAGYVLACESSNALRQAEFLESIYRSGVDFSQLTWDKLDPGQHGIFDIVHCHGLFHRVLDPMSLLRTLRKMMARRGMLLISSMVLGDPERSEFLRFVPDRHAGDPTWWFVPGRLAYRWMIDAAGFRVESEFGEIEGPRDGFPVVTSYLAARAAE